MTANNIWQFDIAGKFTKYSVCLGLFVFEKLYYCDHKSRNMEDLSANESQNNQPENNQQSFDNYDDDEYNSDNEDFYFESDHLPLRGNSDYRAVLRTIVILEAQRIEAAKHIDKIVQEQQKALRDPEDFLKKLTSKTGLELPGTIDIQNVNF